MNIFYFDECPIKSARAQPDKMLVKMPLETAQMLCTAHRELDGDEYADANGLYKRAYWNHPCTIWTRESMHNYRWHYLHFAALCDEYTYRYGKKHLTDTKLRGPLQKTPNNIPVKKMTQFKLAMKSNPECMMECPIESYRAFYQTKQHRFNMIWTKREKPRWFNYANI